MVCKLHSRISIRPPPLVSVRGEGGVFPSPSLFLAKATDQLQKEVAVDKTISIIKFYVFGPILQPVTKHWGHKAEQETQCIRQIHPTILSGQLLCAQHCPGCHGTQREEVTQGPGPPGIYRSSQRYDTRQLGVGGGGWGELTWGPTPCVICALVLFFKIIFQNRECSWKIYQEEIA